MSINASFNKKQTGTYVLLRVFTGQLPVDFLMIKIKYLCVFFIFFVMISISTFLEK